MVAYVSASRSEAVTGTVAPAGPPGYGTPNVANRAISRLYFYWDVRDDGTTQQIISGRVDFGIDTTMAQATTVVDKINSTWGGSSTEGTTTISTTMNLRVGAQVLMPNADTLYFNICTQCHQQGINGYANDIGGNELYIALSRIATNTVGHEFAHNLGLQHSANRSGSIVSYDHQINPPNDPRSVIYSDRYRLQALYGAR